MIYPIPRLAKILLAVALLSAPPLAQGDPTAWSLTTGDLKTVTATLVSIDATGVHVSVSGEPRTVPTEQFVELSRPLSLVAASGRFVLYLADGGRVGGEPVAIKGEQLVWNSPIVGETAIPLRLVTGLSKMNASPPPTQGRDDVVLLVNGDTTRGAIADISTTAVKIQSDSGAADLPLDSVKSVSLASAAGGGRDKSGIRIRLDDATVLLGAAVTVDATGLQLSVPTADGNAIPRAVDLTHVVAIEQINGPVCWLSSRSPSQNIYLPYYGSNLGYIARMNLNCDGQPIRFQDTRYQHGIGAHAYSKVVFPLDGKTYRYFRSQFAIDDSVRDGSADVTVRVFLDDKLAFEKTHVRPGQAFPPVVLDLNGARNITLEVGYGDYLGAQGRLDWIEPALLKVMPAAQEAPAEILPATPATTPAQ